MIKEIQIGGMVIFFTEVSGFDLFGDGCFRIQVNDELDAARRIELMKAILPYDEVLESLPIFVTDPATKLVLEIEYDLHGIMAMGVGDAIGKEDGGNAIP